MVVPYACVRSPCKVKRNDAAACVRGGGVWPGGGCAAGAGCPAVGWLAGLPGSDSVHCAGGPGSLAGSHCCDGEVKPATLNRVKVTSRY